MRRRLQDWPRWIGYLTAGWSLTFGALGVGWALGQGRQSRLARWAVPAQPAVTR